MSPRWLINRCWHTKEGLQFVIHFDAACSLINSTVSVSVTIRNKERGDCCNNDELIFFFAFSHLWWDACYIGRAKISSPNGVLKNPTILILVFIGFDARCQNTLLAPELARSGLNTRPMLWLKKFLGWVLNHSFREKLNMVSHRVEYLV